MLSFPLSFDYAEAFRDNGRLKPAPFICHIRHAQTLVDGVAFLFFDTEEELKEYYNQVVGDDGPTEANPYDGPCRVYALTCGPDGQLLNENT